ncbi:hypothetical protein BP5796_10737 [Coleophoma crateriformis]|uniref:Uncharacterized protein n=1 Tax=Coleophoma crateriformis TaxID=565419 RepID=A0A3D8QR17_9HELO|nr:hypothetical protein BP5796_10737 [Coleophoma crateriformis]
MRPLALQNLAMTAAPSRSPHTAATFQWDVMAQAPFASSSPSSRRRDPDAADWWRASHLQPSVAPNPRGRPHLTENGRMPNADGDSVS